MQEDGKDQLRMPSHVAWEPSGEQSLPASVSLFPWSGPVPIRHEHKVWLEAATRKAGLTNRSSCGRLCRQSVTRMSVRAWCQRYGVSVAGLNGWGWRRDPIRRSRHWLHGSTGLRSGRCRSGRWRGSTGRSAGSWRTKRWHLKGFALQCQHEDAASQGACTRRSAVGRIFVRGCSKN